MSYSHKGTLTYYRGQILSFHSINSINASPFSRSIEHLPYRVINCHTSRGNDIDHDRDHTISSTSSNNQPTLILTPTASNPIASTSVHTRETRPLRVKLPMAEQQHIQSPDHVGRGQNNSVQAQAQHTTSSPSPTPSEGHAERRRRPGSHQCSSGMKSDEEPSVRHVDIQLCGSEGLY